MRSRAPIFSAFMLAFVLMLTGCGDDSGPASGTGVVTRTPTELVFAFQKQKDPREIQVSADQVAEFLTKELSIPVKVQVPSDYGAIVQAMVSGKVDIAYTDSIPYLLAQRDAGARILLAEQRVDLDGTARTDYDSIFVVSKDSRFTSLSDIKADPGSVRLAFVSPTSTSGYAMAYRRLVKEGVLKASQDPAEVFDSVSFAGSYTQALTEVAEGRADLCAVSYYTMEGPRADVYLDEASRQRLRILARTPGVPTHVISARGELPAELLEKIKAALLKLSGERPDLLADVYGAKTLVEVDGPRHVAATIEAIEYLGKPVDAFVNK